MRAGLALVIPAAALLGGGYAVAACPDGARNHCVVNLDLVPQISQQIVATEHIVAPPRNTPAVEPAPAYTGPIVGTAKNLRRAPEVGYRWSLE